ncbi:MAG: PHP domain-containing protein [Clostridiales bacterium]|nr:PHP domain-containing protein [Clostridiales bacterium]
MRADLHLHSIYSDGHYTPEEMCRLAKESGVEFLSITDHDTMNGLEIKRAAAKKFGLRYVCGWEISAYDGEEKIHILGYGCKEGASYEKFLKDRQHASIVRVQESVEKFQKLGVPVTVEEVLALRVDVNSPVHSMLIARAAAKHLGITEGETYARFLNRNKPAHSSFGRPTPKAAIDCIHALGGIACIAHPGRITMPAFEKENLLKDLADYGADGIEAYYSTHTNEETEYFKGLAKKWGVFVTGGSDTHYLDAIHRVGNPVFHPSDKLLEQLLKDED